MLLLLLLYSSKDEIAVTILVAYNIIPAYHTVKLEIPPEGGIFL